jgi:hypothetical protein
MCYCAAQSERKSHTRSGNANRHFPIAKKDPHIDLEANDKQE